MTDHFELSTMTGTVAMSGSAAMRRRNRVIAATPSSIASSMLTSIIWAPFVTCSRAMSTASSSAPSAISRANLREPGDVRPLADVDEGVAGRRDHHRLEAREAGRPGRLGDLARRQAGDRGGDRGDVLGRRAAAAAGDVEQAVPRPLAERLGHLLGRLVVAAELVRAGRRSGRPRSGRSATRDRTSRCSRSCFGPSAQLSPTMSGSAWRMLCQNASTVWPDRVRPDASTIVPEMISGTRSPVSSKSDWTAAIAAFALSVSKIVSIEQDVGAALEQAGGRFAVGDLELLPGDAAGGRIADVRAHRGGAVRRAERAGDEARAVRARLLRRRRRRPGPGARPRR